MRARLNVLQLKKISYDVHARFLVKNLLTSKLKPDGIVQEENKTVFLKYCFQSALNHISRKELQQH